MTSVWVLAVGLLMAQAAMARGGMADRLGGYVAGCRAALLTGDVSAFRDLTVETEMVTDTVSVMGWRGADQGGLTVSLLRRGASSGVCDVAFRPLGPDAAELDALARLAEDLAVAELAKPDARVEMAQAGQVVLACDQGRGTALFLDPTAKGQGFAAQLATVPPHRMECRE